MININDDRYTQIDKNEWYDEETNNFVNKKGEIVGKRQKLSSVQQQALNNYWAVINDEKTYKEAFGEK